MGLHPPLILAEVMVITQKPKSEWTEDERYKVEHYTELLEKEVTDSFKRRAIVETTVSIAFLIAMILVSLTFKYVGY